MITSKSLSGFAAVLLVVVSASLAKAAGVGHDVSCVLAGNLAGQTGKPTAADRREVEALLARARQALKQGDLATAENVLSSAEKLNVSFGVLHLGDTPRKLRADLEAAKRSPKKAIQRPSEKFTPPMPTTERARTKPIDPSKQAPPRFPQEVTDPKAEAPLAMPANEGRVKPAFAPLGREPSLADEPADQARLAAPGKAPTQTASEPAAPPRGATGGDARKQSDFHLLSARKALAVGDTRRAHQAVEAARAIGAEYGLHDDTPDKVAAAIRTYEQVKDAGAKRQDEAARRELADALMDQAQQLMQWKEYDEAERLVRHVEGLRVNYGPFDTKPASLLARIAQAKAGGVKIKPPAPTSPQPTAKAPEPAPRPSRNPFDVTQAGGGGDGTRNRPASAQEHDPSVPAEEIESAEEIPPAPISEAPQAAQGPPEAGPQPIPGETSEAMRLYLSGQQSLQNGDKPGAVEQLRQAYELRDQLDPATAQRLQDQLQLLAAPAAGRGTEPAPLLEGAAAEQSLLVKQVSNDLTKKTMAADKVLERDPTKALEILKEARAAIEASGVDAEARGPLLRRVDRKIADVDKYILAHKHQIALDGKNAEILKEVERRLQTKLEIDDKLALLVDDFNKLMDEGRYAEAEVLAKRARELAPDNPLTKQLIWNNKFIARNMRSQAIRDGKEDGYNTAMLNVDESAQPFDDNNPIRFGDARTWSELTKRRSDKLAENQRRRNERELEIERKLQTPVSLQFRERPLAEVLEHLAKLAAVNLHLDPKGLDEEGVTSETPVTIDLTREISLKSALNLILEPLNLSYVIKDEVLKITSEQLRDGEVLTVTYNVADLVIPIPNFGPNARTGMPGAIADAYNMTGTGVGLSPGSAYVASRDGTPATGTIDPAILAQINQLMPGSSGAPATGLTEPMRFGPGGMGGGAQADFDSLIELITTTVRPQTWDEVGGPGSISPFQNNLSLVISQTADVHDEIRDLLEQLRRNQDLQVTIEVRFITLSDTFFERIGVDFDFNIVNTSAHNDPRQPFPKQKNEVVGLNPPGPGAAAFPNYTGDLSIPFRQESFDLAVPQFGTPVPVANFGFAILSDLEAFLLVQAAQGDRRSNVLQAPKVTLFNGQLASVFDQTQQPFVISVIPVVGDFAAAYQPVITVLSQGQALTVQAIISHDRRFVRLTVLPMFSHIHDVSEFRFTGSTTTTNNTESSSTSGGTSGDSTSTSDDETTTTDGVTVQLPNFSFVSVTTTVSVPDGGTVLLGGIKRLSEGRNEFGVPLLSKLPYIDRLFKNVGIGRETQSLMMMVTPRIIIQEEEEERLGIQTPP